jgi:hypothetical protein
VNSIDIVSSRVRRKHPTKISRQTVFFADLEPRNQKELVVVAALALALAQAAARGKLAKTRRTKKKKETPLISPCLLEPL